MCFRSSLNACRSSSLAKYFGSLRPHRDRVDDAADQLLDAALPLGRANLPAEIFRDDDVGRLLRPRFGISTSRCSNTISPRSLPMSAERISHSTSSNGSTPASVKNRGNVRPGQPRLALWRALSSGADPCVEACPFRQTAARQPFHCVQPIAGRHLRPGRQRPLSFVRSDHPGMTPDRDDRTPAPRGNAVSCSGNS